MSIAVQKTSPISLLKEYLIQEYRDEGALFFSRQGAPVFSQNALSSPSASPLHLVSLLQQPAEKKTNKAVSSPIKRSLPTTPMAKPKAQPERKSESSNSDIFAFFSRCVPSFSLLPLPKESEIEAMAERQTRLDFPCLLIAESSLSSACRDFFSNIVRAISLYLQPANLVCLSQEDEKEVVIRAQNRAFQLLLITEKGVSSSQLLRNHLAINKQQHASLFQIPVLLLPSSLPRPSEKRVLWEKLVASFQCVQ